MKIHEAAEKVLSEQHRPMHPREILEEIERQGLFQFGAKDPAAIVAQTLRKKSDVSKNPAPAIFRRLPNNQYGLAKWGNVGPDSA